MLDLGIAPEGLLGILPIDLPEQELVERPDDPTIPFLLLDDSAEASLRAKGEFRRAYRIKERRRHLYGVWLKALGRVRFEINDARLSSQQVPFEKVVRFEYRIARGLLLLKLAGFLHFSGISKRLDRPAVETTRRMATLAAHTRVAAIGY